METSVGPNRDNGKDSLMSFPINDQIIIAAYDTPTKRSNAQHLFEYLKQLLYEENQKLGNVMQQPMDSCVCGIKTSSESILIFYFSRDKYVPAEFWYTYFTRNVNLTKRENFLTSNLYHIRRDASSLLHDIPRFLILFLEELFLIFNQMLSIRAFGRRV